MTALSVNINKIAWLRNGRGGRLPDADAPASTRTVRIAPALLPVPGRGQPVAARTHDDRIVFLLRLRRAPRPLPPGMIAGGFAGHGKGRITSHASRFPLGKACATLVQRNASLPAFPTVTIPPECDIRWRIAHLPFHTGAGHITCRQDKAFTGARSWFSGSPPPSCRSPLPILALTLLRWKGDGEHPAEYDLRVYRDQLKEVDRDLARGVISEADADRIRTEVGRRVLAADAQLKQAQSGAAQPRGATYALAGLVIVAVIGGTLALYPQLGDHPGDADDGCSSQAGLHLPRPQ